MLKACKQLKRVMEDGAARDDVVDAALIQLQNEALACATAPEDAERMQLPSDLVHAEGPLVFTTLAYLLEPAAQVATLPFALRGTQKALFRAACGQHFAKKACDLLVNVLDEIQENLTSEQRTGDEIIAQTAELQRLRVYQKQGITMLPDDSAENEGNVGNDDIAALNVFSQSRATEKSEISCALSESSQSDAKSRAKDVEQLIVDCKVKLADAKRSATDLRVEKNALQRRLDQILQFFVNLFLAQADEQAMRFFLKFAFDQCGFVQILEMLYFVSQNGYEIADSLLVIVASASQDQFQLNFQCPDAKNALHDMEAPRTPQRFSFQLCGKTVRVDERKKAGGNEPQQKLAMQAKTLANAAEAPLPRFSALLPSSVRSVDLRFGDAHTFNFKRETRLNIEDRVSGGARVEKQKAQAAATIPASQLKLAFECLQHPFPELLASDSQLFSRDLTLFLRQVGETLERRAESFQSAHQSRFQQIASCYTNCDPAPGQAALSFRFAFVSTVTAFLRFYCQNPQALADAETDALRTIIRNAYNECSELFLRIERQTGELRQQLYIFAVFKTRACEFLNTLARFATVCKSFAQAARMQLDKMTRLRDSQRDMLDYNRERQNPFGVQFQTAEKRFADLCERLRRMAALELDFQQHYDACIAMFCSSRALFEINAFIQRHTLEKTHEVDTTRAYFCMLQLAALLHASLDPERVYMLREGFRERRGREDLVDDGSASDGLSNDPEEPELFEMESTADLIYLHMVFGGKIAYQLIQMIERTVFGPLPEKDAALDAARHFFEFVRVHDPTLQAVQAQAANISSYVVYTKIFAYAGVLDLQFFKTLFAEFVKHSKTEFSENPNYELFGSLFFVKSVRFSALEEPLLTRLTALKRLKPEPVTGAIGAIAANLNLSLASEAENIVIDKVSATKQHEKSSPELEMPGDGAPLSDYAPNADFTPEQDAVLLANFMQLAAEHGDAGTVAALLAEQLDFAFDQQHIIMRIKELRLQGRFSADELDTARKSRDLDALAAMLLCDAETLRHAMEDATRSNNKPSVQQGGAAARQESDDI